MTDGALILQKARLFVSMIYVVAVSCIIKTQTFGLAFFAYNG